MKKILPQIVAAVTIIAVSLGIILIIPVTTNNKTVDELKLTLAFACGYRHGQAAIMNNMPSLFKHETVGIDCSEQIAIAKRHGFTHE